MYVHASRKQSSNKIVLLHEMIKMEMIIPCKNFCSLLCQYWKETYHPLLLFLPLYFLVVENLLYIKEEQTLAVPNSGLLEAILYPTGQSALAQFKSNLLLSYAFFFLQSSFFMFGIIGPSETLQRIHQTYKRWGLPTHRYLITFELNVFVTKVFFPE